MKHADIRKKTEIFVKIKAVSDNKTVGNSKAHIICLEGYLTPLLFVEEGAYPELGRFSFAENFDQIGKSETGIDDVLHDENIAPRNPCFQILGDPDLP